MVKDPASVRVTVLGSGTSVGVPTIGCPCPVCNSADPRDQRLRPSISVEFGGYRILVDTGPDFRQQAIRARIHKLDAVLYTHAHADHILGLDDLRPFNFHHQMAIPIYATAETMEVIQRVFAYIFHEGESESSRPRIIVNYFAGAATLDLFGFRVQPIPLRHGRGPAHGFRFGRFAYLTDHSEIPDSSLELLTGLDTLFLDALRHKPHPTHSTVERSLKYVELLAPNRTWFTHISHDLPHAETEARLPPHVRMAYDGLEIEIASEAA